MARTNNLTDFLTDVSSAIKQKTGDNTPIPASEFDTEILSIETGGNYQSKTLNITQNGNYNLLPDQEFDAISNVNISVSVSPVLQNKTITENGSYTADQNYDGLGTVIVNVQGSTINNQDKEITANGTYTADEGYTGLGTVTVNVPQGEDLQEQLDAQDTIIQQLQDELANKTSGSAKPNVFMQETEPTTKDGIWLKGSYQVDNIVADENIFASEEWNTTKMSSLKAIPYSFYMGSAVSIGTDIYLFGGNGYSTTAYKYNTLTDTYTQLTNIPYSFYFGSTVSIGTDVYLFGSSDSYTTAYKYDTLTNTYTKLTDIPYNFRAGSAVSVGTNIYLFGSGAGSSYNKYAYKYDTLTNTYTQLTDIPFAFYIGSAVSVGTNIYLFGSGTPVANKYAYKYDTLTDTYTKLTDIPYAFYYGSVTFDGIDIYLLGGKDNSTKIQVMTMISNDYGNNSIVISQGVPSHKTNIANYGIQNAKFYYDRVYYQDENGELLNTISTYNGNGTEWVKISGGEE